jgi:hypothetical protein
MRKNFDEICHGCAREVHIYEHHWKTRLGGREETTYFHNGCYQHYKTQYAHNILWAIEKQAKN